MMDDLHISALVEGVKDFATRMLSVQVTDCSVHKIGPSLILNEPANVVALIGLAGMVRGTVVLSLPPKTAIAMYNRIMGESVTEVDGDVADAAAEYANIIAGGTKARMLREGEDAIELSLPQIIEGDEYKVSSPVRHDWVGFSFDGLLGRFDVYAVFATDEH